LTAIKKGLSRAIFSGLIRVNEESGRDGLADVLAGSSRSGEAMHKGVCEGTSMTRNSVCDDVWQADPSPLALAAEKSEGRRAGAAVSAGNPQAQKETGHGRSRH